MELNYLLPNFFASYILPFILYLTVLSNAMWKTKNINAATKSKIINDCAILYLLLPFHTGSYIVGNGLELSMYLRLTLNSLSSCFYFQVF